MAEGVGFEPTVPVPRDSGFQDRRLKPLGHPSNDLRLYMGWLPGRFKSNADLGLSLPSVLFNVNPRVLKQKAGNGLFGVLK